MKITLTGSSGFVGQNLRHYLLNKGHEVTSISLRNDSWRNDVKKNDAAIIHLAGKAHDTSNTTVQDEYFKVNRDLTIEMFKLFLDSDTRDFFYFSSVKAVADTTDGILTEEVTGKPLTPYGKSKLEAEEYLLAKPLPEGKRLFIIRPCMIHGPGNKGNLNLLYKVVEKGLPWPLGRFHNERSFLSIDNLSFLILAMLENEDLPSGVYNFADDDPLSTNELVRLIAEVLGKRTMLWSMSPVLLKTVVKLGDVLSLPLNSERLKKLTESYVVSNAKIKGALKVNSLPMGTKDGLIKTIKSFNR